MAKSRLRGAITDTFNRLQKHRIGMGIAAVSLAVMFGVVIVDDQIKYRQGPMYTITMRREGHDARVYESFGVPYFQERLIGYYRPDGEPIYVLIPCDATAEIQSIQ